MRDKRKAVKLRTRKNTPYGKIEKESINERLLNFADTGFSLSAENLIVMAMGDHLSDVNELNSVMNKMNSITKKSKDDKIKLCKRIIIEADRIKNKSIMDNPKAQTNIDDDPITRIKLK